jgi:hypothetical protein
MQGTIEAWVKAFSIACLAEVPGLLALKNQFDSNSVPVLGQFLVAYHFLAIPFVMALHLTWVGSRPPPVSGSGAVFGFSVYAAQVLLTTPIIALVLTESSYFKNRGRS